MPGIMGRGGYPRPSDEPRCVQGCEDWTVTFGHWVATNWRSLTAIALCMILILWWGWHYTDRKLREWGKRRSKEDD